MGCQKEIVKQIVAGGGDCVIAVKDNQPKLLAAIQTLLRSPGSDLKDLKHQYHETHETGMAASTIGTIISRRFRLISRAGRTGRG